MDKELIKDRRSSLDTGGQIIVIALFIANPLLGMIYAGFKVSSYNKKGTQQTKYTTKERNKIKEESPIYEEDQHKKKQKSLPKTAPPQEEKNGDLFS